MKIGVLGGTFDPVHVGHIEMAEFCLEKFKLDRIMFLPLGYAPHKANVTDKKIRLRMLEAAVKDNPHFFINTLEMERAGKTYTYDTLLYLSKNTNDKYFYIIGGDTVNTLHTWYRAEEDFQMTEFIVINRCDTDITEGVKKAVDMGAKFYFADHTGLNVSSTKIREKVKKGENITEDVGKDVAEIIYECGLYKN